ncbi:GNAT family N-acetyltransferase [Actinotalea sp. M2MS4P-6]|uniref:GNAT family N-acetyltransferase n=1 Tax=Actinotalea sp. M2MS4P-6 TaxID=2983762 RepID=UPI0021E3947B|nr:GNAT family N-acetyltransferase [Actinotalea sp. M2MS4P-6]MCV2392893.1 GNAT family N-acetyltransferase [Actinotalea sp. M2MS4P-6]
MTTSDDPTTADDLTGSDDPASGDKAGTLVGDGLVLRAARPGELDQIGALLTDRGEADDAVDHRLVVEDPDLGWSACAVVVDGDRVVATASLLDEQVRVGQVVLPAGQVELVAVAESHEHRGLARALMDWAHERSAQRGHLLQVMIGIPYFYRLFGYEYAIDIAPARELTGEVAIAGAGGGRLRAATEADLSVLAALQDIAQSAFDVAVPHPPARWRALLAHSASRTWVLERDGVVVASARVRDDEDGLLVAEPAATDRGAAFALLSRLVELSAGRTIAAVHRAGTVTGTAWDPVLGVADEAAEQYYVRVPDAAGLLDALRPVLDQRIAELGRRTGLAGLSTARRARDALVLSTFGAHHSMPFVDGALGPVQTGGPMQGPGVVGGFGVAPDQLGALLLGSRGFAGLRRLRPDVYGDPELGEALFPPLTADVLSYYLPW